MMLYTYYIKCIQLEIESEYSQNVFQWISIQHFTLWNEIIYEKGKSNRWKISIVRFFIYAYEYIRIQKAKKDGFFFLASIFRNSFILKFYSNKFYNPEWDWRIEFIHFHLTILDISTRISTFCGRANEQ